MTLIGGIDLGQITFAELVDKVHDRVFDKDVPEPAKKKGRSAKAQAEEARVVDHVGPRCRCC